MIRVSSLIVPLLLLLPTAVVGQEPATATVADDGLDAEPGLVAPYTPAAPIRLDPIRIDRRFLVLPAPTGPDGQRRTLRRAGELLGDWTLEIAGVPVDGPSLTSLANRATGEPIERVVREGLGRAVDLPDFLLFLDDVLVAGAAGRRGEAFFLPAGRLRAAGVLLHPDDVFDGRGPRRWATRPTLDVDRPAPQAMLQPALDGAVLGPRWTRRFPNGADEGELLQMLYDENPSFALRLWLLMGQLRGQGAEVYLTSTVRSPERGYLMWGAFALSRTRTQRQVERLLTRLEERRVEWELAVDITWAHPDGWEATRDAARTMADSYGVVYATEWAARHSNHYGGVGADMIALALPRRLTLVAFDGTRQDFDLSDAAQPRDLSLTVELIDWIEDHLHIRKLPGDYPHWDDLPEEAGDSAVESPEPGAELTDEPG